MIEYDQVLCAGVESPGDPGERITPTPSVPAGRPVGIYGLRAMRVGPVRSGRLWAVQRRGRSYAWRDDQEQEHDDESDAEQQSCLSHTELLFFGTDSSGLWGGQRGQASRRALRASKAQALHKLWKVDYIDDLVGVCKKQSPPLLGRQGAFMCNEPFLILRTRASSTSNATRTWGGTVPSATFPRRSCQCSGYCSSWRVSRC
jgi:hypothetical protein